MNIPNHVGIIPDGNRRYAVKEGLTLRESYLHGARIALDITIAAKSRGVRHVSFFGTSHANVLKRPEREMKAFREGVIYFCEKVCLDFRWSLHLVGDIDGIAETSAQKQTFLRLRQASTANGEFVVHAGVNYSGEVEAELQPLFTAIKTHGLKAVQRHPHRFITSAGVPPVDLLIRTGGRRRLSGFLPFQTAYAELFFCEDLWGYFSPRMFTRALRWFSTQDRTQGA